MSATPAFFAKAVTLYDHLATNADDKGKVEFYQREVIEELGYPATYASKLKYILEEIESVTQLQKGARNRATIWILHEPPSLDKFKEMADSGAFEASLGHKSEPRIHSSMTEQKIQDLNERITLLETNVNALLDVMLKEKVTTNSKRKVRN